VLRVADAHRKMRAALLRELQTFFIDNEEGRAAKDR
jgi:hypothetical protein